MIDTVLRSLETGNITIPISNSDNFSAFFEKGTKTITILPWKAYYELVRLPHTIIDASSDASKSRQNFSKQNSDCSGTGAKRSISLVDSDSDSDFEQPLRKRLIKKRKKSDKSPGNMLGRTGGKKSLRASATVLESQNVTVKESDQTLNEARSENDREGRFQSVSQDSEISVSSNFGKVISGADMKVQPPSSTNFDITGQESETITTSEADAIQISGDQSRMQSLQLELEMISEGAKKAKKNWRKQTSCFSACFAIDRPVRKPFHCPSCLSYKSTRLDRVIEHASKCILSKTSQVTKNDSDTPTNTECNSKLEVDSLIQCKSNGCLPEGSKRSNRLHYHCLRCNKFHVNKNRMLKHFEYCVKSDNFNAISKNHPEP